MQVQWNTSQESDPPKQVVYRLHPVVDHGMAMSAKIRMRVFDTKAEEHGVKTAKLKV